CSRCSRCAADRYNICCPVSTYTSRQSTEGCSRCSRCCIGNVCDRCVETNSLCICTNSRTECDRIVRCYCDGACCSDNTTTTCQRNCIIKCSRCSRCATDRNNICCPTSIYTCWQSSNCCSRRTSCCISDIGDRCVDTF